MKAKTNILKGFLYNPATDENGLNHLFEFIDKCGWKLKKTDCEDGFKIFFEHPWHIYEFFNSTVEYYLIDPNLPEEKKSKYNIAKFGIDRMVDIFKTGMLGEEVYRIELLLKNAIEYGSKEKWHNVYGNAKAYYDIFSNENVKDMSDDPMYQYSSLLKVLKDILTIAKYMEGVASLDSSVHNAK